MRRDEVERALQLVSQRWGDKSEWVDITIADVRNTLKLDDLSIAGENYNVKGVTDTSRAAALANLPRSGTQREAVLDCLAESAQTDEEVSRKLKMVKSSAGTRRGELVEGGWVEDTGLRRKTRLGNMAIVWGITQKARESLA